MTRTTWLGAMAALLLLLLGGLIPAAAAQTPGACGTGPLHGDRVALLIGNSAYDGYSWAALANSRNDVAHVCSTLTDAGYAVRVVADAEHDDLLAALDRFAADTRGAGTVVVYYAGHGFQYAQKNYVVPTDAPPMTRRSDLDLRFVSLETIAEKVIPDGAVALFLVDACRTADPVVRLADQSAVATDGGVGPIGLLSLSRGAVLYSTAIGAPAYDDAPVGSRLSPFATAAGRYLSMPVPLTAMFGAIESEVPELTEGMARGEQEPFHYGRKLSGLYLVEPKKLDAVMTALPPAASPRPASSTPGPGMAATRGATPAIAPLDLPLARLAIEDEPIVVARLLASRSATDIAGLAQSGDPVAQHILGYMLEFGVGVARDLPAARGWLERSAASDYAPGQLEYGYLLMGGAPGTADRAEGERLYRAAAASGYAKAKTHLAYQLMTGGFGSIDKAGADRLFVEAAEAGHPVAMFFAALNPAKHDDMIARLRVIAQGGNVEGNLWLCELAYLHGRIAGAFNDCAIAARSSVMSGDDTTAETAHANAMAIVALAYRSGDGVEVNPAMARQWAMRAVEVRDLRIELRKSMDAILAK